MSVFVVKVFRYFCTLQSIFDHTLVRPT